MIAFCAALVAPAGAFAQGIRPSDAVSARLLPGWQTAQGTRMAALRVDLAPDWKTYWRVPGEAGIPPQFDLSASRNIASVRMHWPVPRVFDQAGMRSYGYFDRLILPMEFTPVDPQQPMHLEAEIAIGVCREICMPVTLDVAGDLSGAGADDAAITAALDQQPETGARAGLRGAHCTVSPVEGALEVTAYIDIPRIGNREIAVFEMPRADLWVSETDNHREGSRLTARAEVSGPGGAPASFDRSEMRITVLAGGRAVEIDSCPPPAG